MILAIDTTQDKKSIALFWPGKIKKVARWQENKIDPLEKIEIILKKNNLSKKDIKWVVVDRGPGSFTGVRMSITIANTLRYSLKIPTLGVINKDNLGIIELAKFAYKNRQKTSIKKIISPYYGKEPNITKPKDRKKISM